MKKGPATVKKKRSHRSQPAPSKVPPTSHKQPTRKVSTRRVLNDKSDAFNRPPLRSARSVDQNSSRRPSEPSSTRNTNHSSDSKENKPPDGRVLAVFNRVFSGEFYEIPSPLSKLVRVFTSSTFTDTMVERNALMEEVYPALKRYCRETHGLDFQVVDMRWGVRDEATDDHMTTNLCINEIHNCQRLSMGPNFVVFLCQKYGYRPIPSQILASELDLLKQVLKDNHEDVSVLDLWYVQDSNAVPAQYILQPISSILVNFNNKRIPKLQEQDAKSWWEVEARMQNLLRKGAKICLDKSMFTANQMHNYYMSVTEREVINGILNAENPNEHCLCYVRVIKNINLNQAGTASKFIDLLHKQINQEAQVLLDNLRDQRVPAVLRAQNIRKSCVEWAGREGMDPRVHADYLKEFLSDFYTSITSMVDAAMRKHAMYRDLFFAEVLQHMWNGIQGSNIFGREKELDAAKTYITTNNNYPLIFFGEHGCGKTSIMAKVATESRKWLMSSEADSMPVIILRFLGTSPDSSSIGPLLVSVCEQIAYNYNPSLKKTAPTELSKLFQHFKRMTTFAAKTRPLIIILDSLDLLSKMDGTDELLWFPPALPPFVKLIVSFSSGTGIEMTMRRLVEKEDQYILVPPLGPQLGKHVIEKWLEKIGRTLTQRQWEIVNKALSHCTLPLFLKLVYVTVARWKSYSKPQDVVLFKSVQQSIHALFDRTESQHGKLLVSHALSYITAAKSGISDSELEDLISLDDKVLDDIYQYHLPPVRRIPPLLWSRIRADLPGYLSERAADGVIVLNWYHEQFRTAANERYFKNLNHLQNTHSAIADYFLGIWGGVPKPYQYTDLQKQRFGVVENEGLADRKVPKQPNLFKNKEGDKVRYNSRKLNELPYHLLRSRRLKELFSLCLFNFEFLQAKMCCFPLQGVILDFEDAITKCEDPEAARQLTLVVDGLRLSASLLSRYPWMFAFEITGRLLPLVADNNDIKNLMIGCDLQSFEFNCFMPANHCFHSPGGPLKYSMEEHPFAVFGMALSSDQKMLASVSNQLIVWDVHTGDLTRIINPGIEGIFLGMDLSKDDKYVVAFSNNNTISIMSLITGDHVNIDPDGMEGQMEIGKVVFTEEDRILFWSASQYYLYDVEGKLLHRERIDPQMGKKNLIEVFYKDRKSVRILTWSGDKDDWNVTMVGREENKLITPYKFAASLTFFDSRFVTGIMCVEDEKHPQELEPYYKLVTFEIVSGEVRIKKTIIDRLEEKTNAIFYCKGSKTSEGGQHNWMIGVTVEGYLLCEDLLPEKLITLKLPGDVRNIPIKPMHTTSAVVLSCNDTFFVSGVRKNFYIFNIASQQLARVVEAHFGRILSLKSLSRSNYNLLISSSIDRSIKIWNMENIFEKSFSVVNMDQSVEKITIPKQKQSLALIQTRKYLSLWNIRNHTFICQLVTNQFGSMLTDSMITSDGKLVVCIESDQLLVWDLKTQSVSLRMPAQQSYQLLSLYHEKYIGILYKHVETNEQKICRLIVYRLVDLSIYYTYEFNCKNFRDAVVLPDTVSTVVIANSKSHEQVQVINITERAVKTKFRPKLNRKMAKDMIIQKILPMPENANQVILMDNETRGNVFDLKTKKVVRHLPAFTGACTNDGKLGINAPSKGGLQLIDLKTGQPTKTLIGQVAEGVNDVQAKFTTTGQHILYYHNGLQILRTYRVSDGQLIGTLRPHSRVTTWTSDSSGQIIVIGGLDGSLLTTFLYDDKTYPDSQKSLANLPSRKYLADHLNIVVDDPSSTDNTEFKNLTVLTKAVQKFKSLINKDQQSSQVCTIQ